MKKILSTILLLSIFGMQIAPVEAALKSGVSETRQAKQEAKAKQKAQQKEDKELYKKVKEQKDLPYKKYKVANKYDFINLPWWEQFNDPYLTGYINKAMEHNYDLKMATLTVDEYFQGVRAKMANEMPQVSTGLGYGVAGIPPVMRNPDRDVIHGIGMPVIASYEADIFLKNHDKTTSQKKLFQASVSDERATYIAIVSAVGTVYYNIVKLDKAIALQEDIVSLRKEIYELMTLSHENGIISTSDMIKAEKSYINGQTVLIDLKRQRNELLNQLAVLVGESPENTGSFERISYDDINYTYNLPDEISSDVIIQRPDYIKAEVMLKKAGIDVRVAKKEFLPTISINGLALFGSTHFGSLFTTKNMIWALAGNAMQPIFTGGALLANFRISKVRFEKALRNYQKTNLVAIQEVNDALYNAKMDNKKLDQNKEHLKLETQDFGLTELKLEQGVISKLDWCQMKESLLVIEKLVAVNTLDCMIDEINLYKATGT
ncbi:MAG: TolC family protein, partial [Cyanobacteria bacterium RUI128]|nr:TolC family protein [Cyanobacteria bacterium RUI128]